MEIDDQTQRNIKKSHVAEQLSLMDWMDFIVGFDLDKQAPIDQQIESQRILALKLLISNNHVVLCLDLMGPQLEFHRQAPLIY